MQIAQEVYVTTVKGLPTNEQLELASLILAGVTQKHNGAEVMPVPKTVRRSALDTLVEWQGQPAPQITVKAETSIGDNSGATAPPRRSMRQILDELPGGRIFKTPEEVDAYLREERDSWER